MESNYVTKEDFNKFKEQLKPIIMNVLERLDTIEGKIDKVYDLTQELASKSNTVVKTNTPVIKPNSSELIKYNRDNVKELFSATDDDFTKKFCQSILSKDYNTLTEKQFKKLMELANKANYYKPIKKDE